MGAYLSAPNTEKISLDESQGQYQFGVSGMQGWRMSMEDAHCCLPDIDGKNNALFGVFDGHGGREVAEYCAQNVDKFLLDNESYQEGKIDAALKESFMAIDEAITSKEVIEILKTLGGLTEEENEEEEDEAAMLLEEAHMPLEELLQKFKGNVKEKLVENGILLEKEEEKEPVVNGINGHESLNSSSRSRKQKKPVKRNLDGDQDESSAATSLTTVGGSSSSSATATESVSDSALKDTPEEVSSVSVVADSSSSSTSAASKDLSALAGSSSGNTVNSKSNDEPDYNAEEKDGDDEEDSDNEDEDEDHGEEDEASESDSEEEFEDSEGVEFQQGSDEVGKDSGTTAIVALIHNKTLYVANVGDSRCVLCRNGRTMDMSVDHKPEDEIEKNRIEKAGGKITMDGRVNGGLNLSRAIGDHTYKQNKDLSPEEQVISAYPDVKSIELTPDDDFMVLACDGIWNMMSSEEVINFVRERINEKSEEQIKLSKICEELFDHCLAPDTDNDGSGCDNMTCTIVRFKHDSEKTSTSIKRKLDSDEDRESKKAKLSSMD